MTAAARAMVILIAVAIAINFLQGGPHRVGRWAARMLTGTDLVGPAPGGTITRGAAKATRPLQAV